MRWDTLSHYTSRTDIVIELLILADEFGCCASTPSSFVPLPASGLRQENIGVKLRGISEASTEARAWWTTCGEKAYGTNEPFSTSNIIDICECNVCSYQRDRICCCVLVYDDSDRASFVSLNEHIDDLVVQAQPDAYKFKYVVLGNKVDIRRPRALKNQQRHEHDGPLVDDFEIDIKDEPPNMVRNRQPRDDKAISVPNCPPVKSSHEHSPKHRHYISWGYWEEQPIISEKVQ
ncbi:hypothetical protein YC2023_039028 [Brassica napus]